MIEIYYEGGPRDGTVEAIQGDPPPVMILVVPKQHGQSFEVQAIGDPEPITFNTEKIEYYREFEPYREGCVTYFFDSAMRDRVTVEDRMADRRDWEDHDPNRWNLH